MLTHGPKIKEGVRQERKMSKEKEYSIRAYYLRGPIYENPGTNVDISECFI